MVGTFARGLALAVAWAAVGVPAHAVGTTDITTSRDTWLEQSQPDSNRGTDTPLRASGAPGGAEVPLLYFDLSPIPANEVVTAASLRIKVDTADSAPVDVAEVLGAWTEPVATWNNTAALVDRSRTWATFTPSATGPITVDVTGLVQVWTTTRTGQGLALVATTSGQSRYDSREVAAAPQRPVLQITTASDAAVVDVGLTVAVDKTTAAVGDTLTYTVTATNYGGAAAASVSVGDFVPANTSFLGATTTQGTYTRLIGTWSVGSLAADASATLTLSVAVQPSAAGTTVTNTGFLWFTSPSDGASGNDSMAAATSVPDGSTVDLAATKSVDNPAPTTGQTVEFTITVMNGGGSDATGVALADSLPSGLTYQWDTPSVGDYDPITGIWQVGNLGTGATATLHVAATVNPGTEGMTLVNRVSVLAVDQPDTDPANDADSASVSVVSADLFATVGVDDANPREGDAITFTVGVGDSGPSAANGIVLAAALPPGLSFQSAAPGVGTYDSGTGRWTVGALASGQTVSMDLVALVDGGTGGDALDVVAVVTDANEPDPDGSNDADTVRVVVQSADVAVTVGIDDAAPREGDTVHLTVRAANLGPNDVAGVQILDTLPAGLSMSTWTASHGSWNPGSGVWDLGALSALSSDSLSITATVVSAARPAFIKRPATEAATVRPM